MFSLFQIANRDDPLTNPKSMRLWVSNLPANDPVGAVETMIDLLESPLTTESYFSASRLQAILELDRLSAPLQERLQAQHRVPALSDDVRERLWRACDNLAHSFALVYERICDELGAQKPGDRPHAALHGVFARLFFHVGVQARHGLFRYEQWIPGRWRALHRAYTVACKHAVVAEPYVLDPAANELHPLSPEQEYLQILLVQQLNTGNLSAHQIELAAQWLREWVPQLRLAILQPDGDGYWLDLGQGNGLLPVPPELPKGELLYLDVGPLRERLNERLAQLAAGAAGQGSAGSRHPELGEQLDLAQRLDALWLPSAPPRSRRGERRAEQRAVTVAIGWKDIASTVSLSQTATARNQNAPDGYQYDDYGRLRLNDARRPALPGNRAPGRDVWQVHDASDSGFRVRSSPALMAGHRLGALLVLEIEGDKRWQVGIVRRLKKLNAEQIELGVEVIARNAWLVIPRSLDNRSSGYSVDGIDIGLKAKSFNALYLPGQPRLRGGARPSLVLPPSEFTVGRSLSVHVASRHHDIVLAPPIERSKDWVWTPLALDSEDRSDRLE
ncbi:MAG: hypothetical protein ABI831_05785 [Betaproteobacteria bacterium]